MIFHDFEEHSGNYVTKNQGKSDRCPAFAADPSLSPTGSLLPMVTNAG
jgi:hypothetical protein